MTTIHRTVAGRCALVMVAAAAVYANSLLNGFALDDVHIILHNVRVHSLSDPAAILLTPYWPQMGTELGLYRPLIILWYALQWAIGGGAPWLFHGVSIALHAATAVLVLLLLERLATPSAALAGALVFAVHPLHTEAVANIVGQAELVAAVALLAACLLHVTRDAGVALPRGRMLALVALFAVALGAKESAVVLPALLVIVDLALRRITLTRSGVLEYARTLAVPLLLMAGVLGAYLAVRYHVLSGVLVGQGASHALPYLTEEHRLLNAFRAFPEVLRLFFLPVDLASDYMPGVLMSVNSWTPATLLGAALLAACVFMAGLIVRRPELGFPAAWLLVTIAPVSNIFFPIGVPVAERTLYLPSVAVSALLACAWQAIESRQPASRRAPRAAFGVLAVIVVLLGVRTWIRNPDWSSTDAVIAALARDHPESYRVQASLAYASLQQDRLAEAEVHFAAARGMYGRDAQLLMAYASFMVDTDRAERAAELLEEAVALQPGIPRPARLLAHAYLVQARFDDALRVLDDAAGRNVDSPLFAPLRAYALHGLGHHNGAVTAWRAAAGHQTAAPWQVAAYVARAFALAGRTDDALSAAGEASRQAPDPAAAATASALERAIYSGCYGGEVSTSRVIPDCDPLGDWFVRGGMTRTPTALHGRTIQSVAAGAAP
jgi:protein O-mannosyl-transferase